MRMAWVAACWSLWMGALSPPAGAQDRSPVGGTEPRSVGVVPVGERSATAVSHLTDLLGYAPRSYPSETARDRTGLLTTARAAGERHLILVDGARARVEVIRVSDGSVLARSLADHAEPSAYALAFVASELLKLSMQAETGVTAPDGAAASSPAIGWLLAGGAEMRGDDRLLWVRPTLELGASVHLSPSPISLAATLRMAPFGSATRGQAPERLSLAQHDISLNLAAGIRSGRYALLAVMRGGLSVVSWTAPGVSDSADRQVRGFLGAALRGRVNLLQSLGLFLEGGGALTPLKTRYLGPSGLLLAPGRLDAVVLGGLSWDSTY